MKQDDDNGSINSVDDVSFSLCELVRERLQLHGTTFNEENNEGDFLHIYYIRVELVALHAHYFYARYGLEKCRKCLLLVHCFRLNLFVA